MPTSPKVGVGVGAPAYHRKEGATLHPGACKHGLQYVGLMGAMGCGLECGIYIVSVERGGEVSEELRKRMINMC